MKKSHTQFKHQRHRVWRRWRLRWTANRNGL